MKIYQDSPRILFYSSVKTKRMFAIQQFYRTDIHILRDLGCKVSLSRHFYDFFAVWKYDIAFIYFYRYGFLAGLLARLLGKKVLFTGGIDNLDRSYAKPMDYWIQRIFFFLCNAISHRNILVSNSDRKNIQAFRAVKPEEKFPLSFHVIDYPRYYYTQHPQKEKLVVTIAWMLKVDNVLRKGVDQAVLFFKELYLRDKSFRMLILGPEGEGSAYLRKILKEQKMEGIIELTGAVDEGYKIDVLKRSAVYVQLSVYEGFGIAAVEALASGNIVVHTGKGGLADGVGPWGLLAGQKTHSILAEEVLAIIGNTEKWNQMISNGVAHVERNFNYDKRLKDFQFILNSL